MIKEEVLYYLWNRMDSIITEDITCIDGKKITVLSAGKINQNEGPDFNNVSIKIDNRKIKGDVEIHRYMSDWYKHNHHFDKRYNRVILHVSMFNQKDLVIRKNNGRIIPNLVLDGLIKGKIENIKDSYYRNDKELKSVKHKCYKIYEKKGITGLENLLEIAGRARINNKLKSIKGKKKKHDFINIYYNKLFRVCGYSRNKEVFKKIVRIVNYGRLMKINSISGLSVNDIESIFMGSAGFLSDDFLNMMSSKKDRHYYRLKKLWKKYQVKYGFTNKINILDWHFFRHRPDNFPIRRLGNVIYIIKRMLDSHDYFKKLISKINIVLENGNDLKDKNRSIIKLIKKEFKLPGRRYWTVHYNFGQKSEKIGYLFGEERTKLFLVNWFYPLLISYYRDKKNDELEKQIWGLLNNIKIYETNIYTRIVKKQIFGLSPGQSVKLNENALINQGMIHIYLNYCVKKKCEICPLSKN